MRGNPVWQLLMAVVAFGAMGWPVWRLTRPAEAAPVIAVSGTGGDGGEATKAAGSVTLGVAADFAPAAAEFALSYLGSPVLQGKAQGSATAEWKVAFPADGADLVLHVAWPTGATAEGKAGAAAARVTVRFPDGRQVEKSFWSADGSPLDTVLSVPGNAAADSAP